MKKLLSLALIALLCAVMLGCAKSTQLTETYEEDGLEVMYPDDWTVGTSGNGFTRIDSPDGKARVLIQITDSGLMIAGAAQLDRVEDGIKEFASGMSNSGDVSISDVSITKPESYGPVALTANSKLQVDGRDWDGKVKILFFLGNAYSVWGAYSPEAPTIDKDLISNIIQSTKLDTSEVDVPSGSVSASSSSSSSGSTSSSSALREVPTSVTQYRDKITKYIDSLKSDMVAMYEPLQYGDITKATEIQERANKTFSWVKELHAPNGYEEVGKAYYDAAYALNAAINYMQAATSAVQVNDEEVFTYYGNLAAEQQEQATSELNRVAELLKSMN